MAQRGWMMFAVLLLAAGAARAEPSCKHAEVAGARAAAEAQLRSGDAAGAVRTLRALDQRCALAPDETATSRTTADFYWFESDLAFALLKAGRPIDCLRLLGPITGPYPGVSLQRLEQTTGGEDPPFAAAIDHNQELCQAAFDRRFAGFTDAPCKSHSGAVEVPGRPGLCLAVEACSGIEIWKEGRRIRRVRATQGPLVDKEWCCELGKLSVRVASSDTVSVRIVDGDGGPSRICGGGTAARSQDMLYEWRGGALVFREDNSIGLH